MILKPQDILHDRRCNYRIWISSPPVHGEEADTPQPTYAVPSGSLGISSGDTNWIDKA